MRRVRLALLLLGLALAVPVTLLVARAREGEQLEREMRHHAVSDRVFDEMERQLSLLLEREEARPFEAYRRLVRGLPSAGAQLPDFVVGHFQIDPDGRLHARPGTAVGRVARSALADVPRSALGDVTRNALGDVTRSALGDVPEAPPSRARSGTLEPRAEIDRDAGSRKEAARPSPPDDAYEAFSRLNLGQTSRAERKQQVRQEPVAKLYGARSRVDAEADQPSAQGRYAASRVAADSASGASAPAPGEGRPGGGAGAEAALRPVPTADEIGEPLRQERRPPATSAEEELAEVADTAPRRRTARVRVALDPMLGLPVSDDRLLLYRTVLVGELGYRQGLLIDRSALAAWLEERVLGGLGPFARLRFDGAASAPDPDWAPSGHRVFEHRFAEPFDAMEAQLALAPLAAPRGSSVFSIYALAGLLALVAAGGMLAVDRMVKVVVSFAERRNRFVASVSHELKTPLTAIRMYAEMLRDGLVRDEAKRAEYYGTITDESERLSRLIDNVLAFSRLERGQREIELVVGSVRDVLQEAAGKLRPHAERQGFALRVSAERGLPSVRFDRDALLQVLFNLVDNAMKYARPAAAAEVVLEARAEGDRVLVGVRDYGPGVHHTHLPRIFEPFYRVEAELTRNAKGTGIGLALVKELGQAMGAAVHGANADGGGFRVMLSFDPAHP